jgi:hypothetical protein
MEPQRRKGHKGFLFIYSCTPLRAALAALCLCGSYNLIFFAPKNLHFLYLIKNASTQQSSPMDILLFIQ